MTVDRVALAVVRLSEQAPADEDVTAGAWGGIMIAALVIAMVILMRSFLKQMRRADAAKRAGVYGDAPSPEPADDEGDSTRR